MKKISIIESCEDCPHLDYTFGRWGDVIGYTCTYSVKIPTDHPIELPYGTLFDIPEWCPLETKE